MGLNDTFMLVLIVSAICAVLALFLGRDPAIEAAKRVKESAEKFEEQVAVAGE